MAEAGRPVADEVNYRGTAPYRDEASALIQGPGDVVVVQRDRPRWFVIGCPCGCGDEVPVNLDRRAGPAWRVYQTDQGISLFPSIWRDSGCRSHFIVWNNRIFLFGVPWTRFEETDEKLDNAVLSKLQGRGAMHYTEIADELGEIPWAVESACARLARLRLVSEIDGRQGDYRAR